MISLDAKTHNVPQYIGAPQHNIEITDLGIESSMPLALSERVTLVTLFFWPWRASIVCGYPVPKSLQGALSMYRGRSSKGHNLELMGAIDEILNAIGQSC